ncbi:M15 family metallopeptidase [Nonomuraea turcica]|uniref:M15 family metallopeptidase n=1 Tax=Nonomuraea sp. G32 TaxID=3067274 RepID=UPI00273CE79F|nr:M15 family metallopeptidase [Nonomuraea sp. G32]MDP4504885.1 M15 family metallopeptidase [Nonomuraea sp. G32]
MPAAHHPRRPTRAGAANRCILGNALASAGFVNYPTEWWHWSFGERYWAYITQARYARYGIAEDLTLAASR